MELDPQRFIWAPVYSCTHWLRDPATPSPSPAFGLMYEVAVSQDRRHLFVTPCPWVNPKKTTYSIGKEVAIKNFETLTDETMKIKFRIK